MRFQQIVWEKEDPTHPYEDKDEHRDKVIGSGDWVLVGQTEEVHDGGTHAQYTLDFVSRRLVCIDGPDLRLGGGPGSLLQVHLQPGEKNTFKTTLNIIFFFYKSHATDIKTNVTIGYLWDLQSFMIGRHNFCEPLDMFMEKPVWTKQLMTYSMTRANLNI